MCLINENGHEISRIVEGEVAHDLSTEEATAIFFEPAFALAPRNVYVSPIYMSPDVHRWVVGYVTPIEVDGEKKAILHYEHDLETYQDLLAEGLSGDDDRFLLAVNEEGWINNQWDIPRLRELLLEILPQRETVEAFEVEHAFEDIGEKIMLLSARRLQRAEDRPSLILVAIEDVTERRRSRWLLEHHKELAEKIVDTVPEPLLVLSEVLPGNEFFEDFEVEHDFPTLGRRTMLLNARRVDHLQLILLAIEDVTERRRAEREREMLVGELNQRVKNSFALMRALVTQGNGARSAEEYRKVLLGRIGRARANARPAVREPLARRRHALARQGAPAVRGGRYRSDRARGCGSPAGSAAISVGQPGAARAGDQRGEIRRSLRARRPRASLLAGRACRRRAALAPAVAGARRSARYCTAGTGLWNRTHSAPAPPVRASQPRASSTIASSPQSFVFGSPT
jgi:hypothetical protein